MRCVHRALALGENLEAHRNFRRKPRHIEAEYIATKDFIGDYIFGDAVIGIAYLIERIALGWSNGNLDLISLFGLRNGAAAGIAQTRCTVPAVYL